MRILADGKLSDNALWVNTCFLEMSKHLFRCCLSGSIGCRYLNSMIHGMIAPNRPDVGGDLAVFQLLSRSGGRIRTLKH
jgi:hypothetical protein